MPGPRTFAPTTPFGRGAPLAAVLLLALGGCGSGSGSSGAHVAAVEPPQTSCAATVAYDVSRVVRRVYHEGVSSERTLVAKHLIASSAALRAATASGDAPAARAAAETLVAGGHMTNLRIVRGGTLLTDVGGSALAPIRGEVLASAPAPGTTPAAIGHYVTSVWSEEGFLAESDAISEGRIDLRAHDRSVGGSLALPPGPLPAEGTTVVHGVPYAYASFGGEAYPAGALRVYVLRSVASTAHLCAPTREATTRATMARIAHLIYDGEAGRRTLPQVRRVQADAPLLAAVAARDPVAARKAVERLLNQHIVRMRVFTGGHVLTDVGGPFVLAPVSAPLRLGGRTIGSFVLSIQDDEGYLRLTRRLAGVRVLMYMNGGTLVKNSLGPEPGTVPAHGRYVYRGATYDVYTLPAQAFPSGPLTIRVLIPVPYR